MIQDTVQLRFFAKKNLVRKEKDAIDAQPPKKDRNSAKILSLTISTDRNQKIK